MFLVLAYWASLYAEAQSIAENPNVPEWAKIEEPARKRALIIALNDYENLDKLTSPPHDATKLYAELEGLGFEIAIRGGSADAQEILRDVKLFGLGLLPGDIAVIYFSGHGVQRGENFFIVPSDAEITDLAEGKEGEALVSLSRIKEFVSAQYPTTLMLFDACRTKGTVPEEFRQREARQLFQVATNTAPQVPWPSDPTGLLFEWATNIESELQLIEDAPNLFPTTRSFVGYATSRNGIAWGRFQDDPVSSPSIFTRHFLSAIDEDDSDSISSIWIRASDKVIQDTSRAIENQIPETGKDSIVSFYLSLSDKLREEYELDWIATVLSLELMPSGEQKIRLMQVPQQSPSSPWARTALRRASEIERSSSPTLRTNSKAKVFLASSSQPDETLGGTDYLYTGALFQSIAREQDGSGLFFAREKLRVRQNPFVTSSELTNVPAGAQVVLLERENAEWVKILTEDGYTGYVNQVERIQKDVEIASTTFLPGERLHVVGAESDFSTKITELVDAASQNEEAIFIEIGTPPSLSSTEELESLRPGERELIDRFNVENYRVALEIEAALLAKGFDPSIISTSVFDITDPNVALQRISLSSGKSG